MLIKTNNKEEAFRAVINTWLKDKSVYCNVCGEPFVEGREKPCCDEPQIGRNIDHCRGVVKQNAELRKTRLNEYASNADKTIRWGISLPVGLMFTLDAFKKMHGYPGLFREDGEIVWFAKKFKQFAVCERV